PASATASAAAASAPTPQSPPAATSDEPEKQPGMSMPDEEDVAELFSGLVAAEVAVHNNSDKPLKEKRFAVIGEYQNDEGNPVLLMVADVALVNYLGSALVMLPRDEAESAIKNNTISDEILESFQEICNISSSLINDAGNSHVRFAKMYVSKAEAPPDNVNAIISNHSRKMDFSITVPGYGTGRLCLIDGTWK
ncbi:MAG: hypothetical protein JXX14_08775, partial [Deltaproteobacteria bacterium]|nr:hypothetical protein [Deltaproteobacteria bacterium]